MGLPPSGQQQTMACVNSGSGGGRNLRWILEKPKTRGYIFNVGSEERRVIPRLLVGTAGYPEEAPFVGVPSTGRSG